MRYSIKQLMLTVALLLSTTMAWAAGEVTIIKKLNGSTSSSAGTVTQSISGGKCTLTITPADGNYITVDFISAERTISGGMAQAPRRSPGMDNNITVMAESSSADPSGVTHYTFDMPGADYDVEVVADFQKRTNISGAVVTLAETMFTYNGQEKTPAIQSVVVGGKTLSANEYTVEYSNNTNAGKGTVTITGLRTYNGTTTADFTIAKATITPSVSLQDWTYGAQANTPAVSGNTGNGAVTYTYAAKGSTTYSETVPTAAGTYTVKATIAETANYQSAEATADFTIGKATFIPTVTLQGWAFGSEPNSPVVSGNISNGQVTFTYKAAGATEFIATVPTAAGTHTVKATIAETENYEAAEATATFSIGKATITPSVTIEGWIYGAQANTPAVSGNTGNGTVTYTYATKGSTTYSETVPTAAGTYTVKATIAETANYQGAEATADFTIGKATITPSVKIEGWTYGTDANIPVVSGNTGNGEVTYTYAAKGSTTFSETVPTAAGTYTVKATIAETANYQAAEATADFTIGKATITPTVTLQGWTYGAQANTPVVSGNTGNGAVTYTYATKGSTTYSETVPTAAGTYTVKATIAETANYQGAEATADFTIGKATISPTVTLQGWTYGAQANTPAVSGNTGNGTVTYTYAAKGSTTFSETVPTAAGTYTIKATIAETANYQGAEATADFTIGKATPEMQLPEAQKLQRDMAGSLSYPISVSLYLNGEKLDEDFVYEFTSSNENIVRIENGNIVPMGAGNATITVTGPINHPNLNAATGSFEVNVYQSYGLTVAGVNVTSDNRADILGDGKVKFNGKSMLVMEGALLTEGIVCLMPELTIFLKDQNSIEAAGQVIVGSDNNQKLVFTTEGNTPGRLELKNTLEGGKTIELFNTIVFEQNLAMLSGLPDEMQLTIGTPVKPITDTPDEDVVVPVPTNPDQDLDNTVVDDVLYTLGDDDYNVDDDGSLSLTTTMIEDDVENVINSYTPGTEEFAEHFSGVTFMVPAGQGKVLVTAKTGEEGVLHVRIGSQEPFVITGALDYKDFEFQYACTQATYVYIYNASNIVVEANNHRAGKKTTVTVGLSSVGVNSSGMQSSNSEGDVDSDVVVLTDDDVEYDAENATLIVHNPEVNTLTDAMFVNFPFLKYLDLRNTSITGINVSREEGPFAGLSKNTFIYMPVGNSTDEPNVIIGNICESVVLDADMAEDESFGISGSFVASIIEFNRIFKKDETTTLCLPFDICASDMEYFGHLYQVKTVGGTSVQIEEVTDGLKAHVPYLFKAATNNTQLYTSDVVEMSMPQESAAPHRAGNNAQLVGCYEPFYGEGETQVFRFMPNDDPEQISFVRIHDEDVIKPFQAYLLTDVEGDILDVTDKEPTAIEGVSSNQQSVAKYFDLQGRRIANGQKPKAKGLYIVNGQKKVIR